MYRQVRFHCTIPAPWGDGYVLPLSQIGTVRIAQQLAARVTSVSDVEQHKFYGWGFWTVFAGCTFDNVVNPVAEDEWWLTLSMSGYLLRKVTFRRPSRAFDAYCVVVAQTLEAIAEVSHIQWGDYAR